MERKGRTKDNVSGERYDSNAMPSESMDYSSKVPVAKQEMNKGSSGKKKTGKRQKKTKKKKGEKSTEDFINDMVLLPVGFLLMASMSLYALKMFYRGISIEATKTTSSTMMLMVQPYCERLYIGLEMIFGPVVSFKFSAHHIMYMTPVFVLMAVQNALNKK